MTAAEVLPERRRPQEGQGGHSTDADCRRWLTDVGWCEWCGAVTGPPCPECGGERYHTLECSEATG